MDQYKIAIFCPRIVAYNESFVPLGPTTNDCIPFAAIWNESISGRNQEDIISTIRSFLIYKRDAANIVLWMDNCSAQNKNWALLSFLVNIVNDTILNAESITLKYFEPGHTFMSADHFHHQVEKSMKKKGKVYDFDDFVDVVKKANSMKNYVKVMQVSDFYDYVDLSSQHKIRKSTPRIYLKDIMEIVARRGSYTLDFKNNHDDEQFQTLDFLQIKYKKMKKFPEITQKTSPKGIKLTTKTAIIEKLVHLMPPNRRDFWYQIPVADERKDTSTNDPNES